MFRAYYELHRKAIHFSSIILPIIYVFCDRAQMLAILTILTTLTLGIDIARKYSSNLQNFFVYYLGSALRKDEIQMKKITSASLMMVALMASCLIFDKLTCIISWSILSLCDPLASILGRKFGKKTIYGKSLEGSAAFFVASIIIVIIAKTFYPEIAPYPKLILACLITTGLEFLSMQLKLDDNILIPLAFCVSYQII
jgi:dolichol kinase